MMEKLEILGYMVENGFDLPLPMDDMVTAYTVQELWEMLQYMLGQSEEW